MAGVIPSYRTYRPRGFVSFTHIIVQVGTLLGALYGYIVSDVTFFAGLSHSNYHLCFLDLVNIPHEPIWSRGDGDGSCESSNLKARFSNGCSSPTFPLAG